jgi:heme/copper-type cytochrome/quinol oxidase subunit 2
VSIRVTSDVADEVHLHGYDKKVDVAPGAPATLTFTADIPGIFEVELESRSIKLIDLVVQ